MEDDISAVSLAPSHFRQVLARTKTTALPRARSTSSPIGGSKAGYNQIPMHTNSIPKTTVITPFGLFEWTKMPFGLMNSGCTFQRVIHEVLRDLPY